MKAVADRPDGAKRKRMAPIHVEAFGWVWGAAVWRRPAEEETQHGADNSDDRRDAAR